MTACIACRNITGNSNGTTGNQQQTHSNLTDRKAVIDSLLNLKTLEAEGWYSKLIERDKLMEGSELLKVKERQKAGRRSKIWLGWGYWRFGDWSGFVRCMYWYYSPVQRVFNPANHITNNLKIKTGSFIYGYSDS